MRTETLWLILSIETVIAVFGARFVVTMYQRIRHPDSEDEGEYLDDELEFDERHPALSLFVDLVQIGTVALAFLMFADIIYQMFITAAGPFFGSGYTTTQDFIGILPQMFQHYLERHFWPLFFLEILWRRSIVKCPVIC